MNTSSISNILYQNVGDAADHIIKIIGGLIHINTIFIASNDGLNNVIMRAYNRDEHLVEEGSILPLELSYCSLVINNEKTKSNMPLIIENTNENELTRHMDVTRSIGGGSFIGLPVRLRDGSIYGTICALDRNTYKFSEADIQTLETMTIFLAYVVELEKMVTDLQQKEIELEQARLKAEKSAQVNRNLLAIMGHEIRTPMTNIVGVADLMMDSEIDPQQQVYMDIIESSNQSMLTLVEDILSFSHMEEGATKIDQEPFDLMHTIHEVVTSLGTPLDDNPIALKMNTNPSELPLIYGDALRLRQILINTLNALRFNSVGQLTLSASTAISDSDNNVSLDITVHNSHMTVDITTLEQLFDSLKEANDMSWYQQYGSIGLNLAISRKLIHLMNGEFEMNSGEQGTIIRFNLLLPQYISFENVDIIS
ncbi:histidine kinase dimerization/phospho-acceptor domain-containing protein [Paenibacillus sp. KACC 21273]|uniref:GAF domain-containing sensor histidine kinase n=1 Tax=Paenibacillus sp. KACC 21273 TaxID=3025665 RepID=UPI002365CF4E|nr:histidine kinase dimerization/phospho-acceptor domain-containing protein [Paenibacillus sp. KACC 21273]WDF52298.1 histidine kinase dimerization/phospho-acceptor domain-containing protein [Paenibacillus sp. KACC 21273]